MHAAYTSQESWPDAHHPPTQHHTTRVCIAGDVGLFTQHNTTRQTTSDRQLRVKAALKLNSRTTVTKIRVWSVIPSINKVKSKKACAGNDAHALPTNLVLLKKTTMFAI